jgi:hypothetical protein
MKKTDSITRCCKLEVVELSSEHRKLMYDLSSQLREAANFIWRQWECWHTTRDTSTSLRHCLAADKAWHQSDKATRGGRPKWTVQPWPKELANELYHKITTRFPGLNSRVLVLLLNQMRQTVTTKQSSAAATKWWIAILLDLDSRGGSRYPQPIPFDSANAKVLPADEKGRVWFEARLNRIERPGKKTGTSTLIRAALKTGGKRAAYAQPAVQMASGDRKLAGAKLTYDAKKRKWFVALSYEVEREAIELDAGKIAVLRPGSRNCWTLRVAGRTWRLGGRGHHVAHKRKTNLLQRWSRQHGYTYSPKRKGRGRDRGLLPVFKLQSAWNNFTSGCNRLLIADVLQLCCDQGVGKVVLIGGHEDRLLATAGKVPDREDSTGWPWYQLEQFLQQSAQRLNVKIELRAFCGGKIGRKAVPSTALQPTRVNETAKRGVSAGGVSKLCRPIR